MNDQRTLLEVAQEFGVSTEAKADKPFGVYVLAVKDKPDEYAVCWSDQLRPGIAQTLANVFRPPQSDGRVWAGESNSSVLRATSHVTPKTWINKLKFSFIKKSDTTFKYIEPLINPTKLIHPSA